MVEPKVRTIDKDLGPVRGPAGPPGFAPKVSVETIDGGHSVTITDEQGPHQFDVLDGTGGGESSLPPGGNTGDLLARTGSGASWVTPANDFDGDNTRPITASAVQTIVGNIDVLLSTI